MKKQATLVIGLPASGKSSYIKTIMGQFDAVFDDVFFNVKENDDYKNILISHPVFCEEKVRNKLTSDLIEAGYEVDYVYFENNPKQCLENAKRRIEKKVDGYIKYLSSVYNPPWIDVEVWEEEN